MEKEARVTLTMPWPLRSESGSSVPRISFSLTSSSPNRFSSTVPISAASAIPGSVFTSASFAAFLLSSERLGQKGKGAARKEE